MKKNISKAIILILVSAFSFNFAEAKTVRISDRPVTYLIKNSNTDVMRQAVYESIDRITWKNAKKVLKHDTSLVRKLTQCTIDASGGESFNDFTYFFSLDSLVGSFFSKKVNDECLSKVYQRLTYYTSEKGKYNTTTTFDIVSKDYKSSSALQRALKVNSRIGVVVSSDDDDSLFYMIVMPKRY